MKFRSEKLNKNVSSEADFGKLFIISGPSGVGKNTIATRLLSELRGQLVRSVTVNTRLPRANEVDGIDYHFVSEQVFVEKIAHGEFLEYAKVHGKYYGSLRADVENILRSGANALLIIDVAGTEMILQQKNKFKVVTIFVAPKDLNTLRLRILNRKSETPEAVATRLQTAEAEMKKASMYNYIVESSTREDDFSAVLQIYLNENK